MLLRRLQSQLAGLYDAPVEHAADDYLVRDSQQLREMTGEGGPLSDEQVFVVEDDGSVGIGLFIDERVLRRLEEHDPLEALDERNLPDFCTALEGVSHFHYLIWSLSRGRSVSLLELELQAEVDKYALALSLMTKQHAGRFPSALHARMFDGVSFLPQLDAISRQRYEEANRHAARYCRALDQKYLHPRRLQPERWVGALRKFFRCSHQEKIRQLAV